MDLDQSSANSNMGSAFCVGSTTSSTTKSTAPGHGWTVKGITFETRASVKKAAKYDGLKLGQWVNQVLQREAVAVLTKAKALPVPQEVVHNEKHYQDLENKIDALQILVEKALLGGGAVAKQSKVKKAKNGKGKKRKGKNK
jgi:hypothetical protein